MGRNQISYREADDLYCAASSAQRTLGGHNISVIGVRCSDDYATVNERPPPATMFLALAFLKRYAFFWIDENRCHNLQIHFIRLRFGVRRKRPSGDTKSCWINLSDLSHAFLVDSHGP